MRINRRQFIAGTAAGGAAALIGGCKDGAYAPSDTPGRALIATADGYGGDLTGLLKDAIGQFRDVAIRGKRVLLKPNLVETTTTDRPINTHPAVIAAAAAALRTLGARSVVVADGPGHRRDIELVLAQSGYAEMLRAADLTFVDLNHQGVMAVANRGGRTMLKELHLPAAIHEADLVVSVAKLKTHHWVGATLSMKNLFGVMPGIVYGWPKNVLHRCGRPMALSIHQCIADICQTVRPGLAIIDGITGMEGDGPIMGTARPTGCVIVSDQLASADATAATIMGMQPHRIRYLRYADASGLGGTNPGTIAQRGEQIARFAGRFELLPHLMFLREG
jgi:uncharacterized protein (DUF362 family)